MSEQEPGLHEWVAAAAAELGVDGDIDNDALLDAARDVAHAVARPATPLTTYLLGLAVGGGLDFAEAVRRVSALTQRWPAPP